MSDRQAEIGVIRELAKRYMEIAVSDKHVRMRKRFRDSNDLKIVRPPLNIEEIPWHEMNLDHELDCVCEDGELRGMEYGLRVALFREKHFRCDNYIEPVWVIGKAMKKDCYMERRKILEDIKNRNNYPKGYTERSTPWHTLQT